MGGCRDTSEPWNGFFNDAVSKRTMPSPNTGKNQHATHSMRHAQQPHTRRNYIPSAFFRSAKYSDAKPDMPTTSGATSPTRTVRHSSKHLQEQSSYEGAHNMISGAILQRPPQPSNQTSGQRILKRTAACQYTNRSQQQTNHLEHNSSRLIPRHGRTLQCIQRATHQFNNCCDQASHVTYRKVGVHNPYPVQVRQRLCKRPSTLANPLRREEMLGAIFGLKLSMLHSACNLLFKSTAVQARKEN